jgi:polar amino acid transport system substrate-binding protein
MNQRLNPLLLLAVLLFGGAALLAAAPAARAAEVGAATGAAVIPNFWDLRQRLPRPALGTRNLHFLTDQDYPPFHFIGADGQLTGFNIDLARAICAELQLACTIQSRRWDTLLAALNDKQGDAIIASLAITGESRRHMEFTRPYYRTPARFAARKDRPLAGVGPAELKGRTVAVVTRSAHEAYLRQFFPDAVARPFPDADAARQALRSGEVETLFGDGVGLAIWLNGSEGECCAFTGGPFLESRFFGDGVGIALRLDDGDLREALDYALQRLWEKGIYADLYLKYFPIGFF